MRDDGRGVRDEGSKLPSIHSSSLAPRPSPLVRRLGLADYESTWRAMQAFTLARTTETLDELWQVQHPPVYTLGVAARAEHLPRSDCGIPMIRTDRGGQITYHGPGQVVVYTLLDLRRRQLGVRALVRRLEGAVIELLDAYGIEANGREDAPGVYVAGAKIAALGLRVRNGCCYHGLSLNVDMDLTPFTTIDPCGHPGLTVTQMRAFRIDDTIEAVTEKLLDKLAAGI